MDAIQQERQELFAAASELLGVAMEGWEYTPNPDSQMFWYRHPDLPTVSMQHTTPWSATPFHRQAGSVAVFLGSTLIIWLSSFERGEGVLLKGKNIYYSDWM